MNKFHTSIFALILSLPLIADNASAANDNKKLKGEWTSVSIRLCIRSNAGFGPNLEALGPTFRTSTQFKSTFTFDGVGSGTTSSEALFMGITNTTSGAQSVSQFVSTCTFDYNVNPDRSFTIQNMVCNGQTIAGLGAGNTSTTTLAPRAGQIEKGKRSFVAADVNPTVETITFTTPTGTFSSDQICQRKQSAVKN